MRITPLKAISGKTICIKSIFPNPKNETMRGSEVAQIFDQKIMPSPLLKVMSPEETSAIVNSVTRSPLQLMMSVVNHPIMTASHMDFVYNWMRCLILCPARR